MRSKEIQLEKFFSAQHRKYKDMAVSMILAPDANLAAADNTSSYYAFERKFLGVVMNSQPGMRYWNGGDGGGKGTSDGGGYKAGIVSQYEFYNAITPMADIGVLGGYYVSFYTKTYQGYDGNWYAKTSAIAFAPRAEQASIKVSYFGMTDVIVGGEVISTSKFKIPSSDIGPCYIEAGHSWIGNSYNALPSGGKAQLRITISYCVYQFWNGNAYPIDPYKYIINY